MDAAGAEVLPGAVSEGSHTPQERSNGDGGGGGESKPAPEGVLRQRSRGYTFGRIIEEALALRRKTFEYTDASGRIPLITKIVYGLPQFSLTSLTMLIGIHGTIFYTKIGADVAFIAFFTALARSFDVVTDPVMGWISDQTRTRWGRRRPFFIVGCWGYAAMFIALFSPPETLDTGQSVALWFGFFYVVFYLFDTMANVPYSALGPELSDDSEQRDSLFFWAKLFNGIGILCGAVGPVVLTISFRPDNADCQCDRECPLGPVAAAAQGVAWRESFGTHPADWYNSTTCDDLETNGLSIGGLDEWCACRLGCDGVCDQSVAREAFSATAWGFGGFYCAAMVILFLAIRERSESLDAHAAPIVPSMLATLRNKPFIGLLPAWVCDMTAYTMIGTMLPFYVEYVIVPSSVPECSDGKRAALGLDPVAPEDEDPSWCKSETWLGFGLIMLIGSQIASMPLWLHLTKRLGKFRTWLAFNLTTAVTNGLFVFIGRGDPKMCMGLAVLNGFPSGAQFLTDSVVADVIDYDEFLTGTRSEARFTIFQTFIPKIVSIPAQAIPLALLTAFGFRPPVNGIPDANQEDQVKIFIQIVFFVLPCGLAILSFLIKSKFPIRTPELAKKIAEGAALHMKGHAARDPLTGRTVELFKFANDDEERFSWKLDNFFASQLDMLVTDMTPAGARQGAEALARLVKRSVLRASVSALVSFTTCVASVAGGLLTDPRLSWLPAFSVILFGMSCTAVAFHFVRYKTAVSLVADGFDQRLTLRWLYHLRGLDDSGKPLPAVDHSTTPKAGEVFDAPPPVKASGWTNS